MENVYINGLPSIAFPPQNGEKGKNGNNFVYYKLDSSLNDNDILLNAQNGISEIDIIENGEPTQLYQINFSNKPNYNCVIDSSKNITDTTILVELSNIDKSKILSICAYKKEEISSEYNNYFTFDTSTNTYQYKATENITYAVYMYYKEKPYKINKYLLGTINT